MQIGGQVDNRSTKSSNKLQEYQKQMNLPELALSKDVPSRNNFLNIMLVRPILVKAPLSSRIIDMTSQAPENFSGSEWSTVRDILLILKLFL